MPHYVRIIDENWRQVWNIDENALTQVGVTNAPIHHFDAGQAWECIDTIFGRGTHKSFFKLELEPGKYHRRVARYVSNMTGNSLSYSPNIPVEDRDYAAIARGQLETLVNQLFAISRTVHPSPANFICFGHDIRNLLILACTEVETHLKGILRANGVSKKSLTIKEYAYVSGPLRLPAYALSFPAFPWLPSFRPFASFGVGDGLSHTLPWYAAYNAVKHNREHEFEKATLGSIFEAVAACAILQVAQFGWSRGLVKGSELIRHFHFEEDPVFEPHEWYYGSDEGGELDKMEATKLDFQIP